MLQAAAYLERALLAEHKADQAPNDSLRESYLEIARSWRNLASMAYETQDARTPKVY